MKEFVLESRADLDRSFSIKLYWKKIILTFFFPQIYIQYPDKILFTVHCSPWAIAGCEALGSLHKGKAGKHDLSEEIYLFTCEPELIHTG